MCECVAGMVYDAVVLFMKAVSDLIERNSTLTAAAITQQMRSTGFRGIFPGPLSFEGVSCCILRNAASQKCTIQMIVLILSVACQANFVITTVCDLAQRLHCYSRGECAMSVFQFHIRHKCIAGFM